MSSSIENRDASLLSMVVGFWASSHSRLHLRFPFSVRMVPKEYLSALASSPGPFVGGKGPHRTGLEMGSKRDHVCYVQYLLLNKNQSLACGPPGLCMLKYFKSQPVTSLMRGDSRKPPIP